MTDAAHMPETSLKNAHCYETFIEGESDNFDWPELDENSASSMCYTSGTTGNPKGRSLQPSQHGVALHCWLNAGRDEPRRERCGDANSADVPR